MINNSISNYIYESKESFKQTMHVFCNKMVEVSVPRIILIVSKIGERVSSTPDSKIIEGLGVIEVKLLNKITTDQNSFLVSRLMHSSAKILYGGVFVSTAVSIALFNINIGLLEGVYISLTSTTASIESMATEFKKAVMLEKELKKINIDDALYSLSLNRNQLSNLSEDDIKTGFKQAALIYHPDKNPNESDGVKFQELVGYKNFLIGYINKK